MSAATLSRRARRQRSQARRNEQLIDTEPLSRVTALVRMLGVPVQHADIRTMFSDECKRVHNTNTTSAVTLICDTLFTHKSEVYTAADVRDIIKSSVVIEASARAFVGRPVW
ncbi:hypothetical protein EhV323 [Emiliania huxleyi virus 86]|uniref:Uncharacterized protein n=2 Tax=root TaxID=1 RepID=Q4A2F6_EHV8U|nr:hypothetical protein EhV323 [Emiliania huxleyi virus 86]UKZ11346.1 hypothetical protein EhVM1_000331 [Emiliania huxleyi virus M1]CAI65750.1 hypothetical protein EhV323 [Emiliania huxleyi virus 86]CAZ69654.1 hypothetical protein [Emiliania huxleyi virus 99B1]|mmetsp:Transcript_8083/g.23952  ORF Transcript_8083/g.23952 Transcript_8083/m.23952 type:complete len:112 (+) Transcript_8083:1870-2205(+)